MSSFFVSSVGLEFCDFFTVIFASALLFPLSVIAVIVTFPSFIPVTIPFSTVAILSLLEIHFTFLFATPSGFTSAVSIAFSPTSIVASLGVIITSDTVGRITILA